MPDIEITLASFDKVVLVAVPDEGNLQEQFNEAAMFVWMLEANNKIRDHECGVNPSGATHEIVKERGGLYRLCRFRYS